MLLLLHLAIDCLGVGRSPRSSASFFLFGEADVRLFVCVCVAFRCVSAEMLDVVFLPLINFQHASLFLVLSTPVCLSNGGVPWRCTEKYIARTVPVYAFRSLPAIWKPKDHLSLRLS